MANPVLNPAVDKATPYAPGAAVIGSWTVLDADNSTERLVFEGVDGSGNAVSAVLDVTRQDTFTMTRVYWERTGTNLAINNAARQATGVMPSV